MNQLYNAYRSRGVVVVGVASIGQDTALLHRFLQAHPVDFPIVLDPGDVLYNTYAAATEPGVESPFPLEVLLGPDGQVKAAMRTYRPDIIEAAFRSEPLPP